MSQNFKGNHFKLMKDMDKDMKDFVIEFFTQSSSENGLRLVEPTARREKVPSQGISSSEIPDSVP